MFNNTTIHTFVFKAMDVNHISCLPAYKLSNNPSKIVGLHSAIHIKINTIVELCVNKYIVDI